MFASDLLAKFQDVSPPLILLTLLLVILIVYTIDHLRKQNHIPGPTGVPLFGYLPFFGKNPHKTFANLRKQYGDIFSVQMGSFPAVVLSGKEVIKEALLTSGDDFSGRPEFYTAHILDEGQSLSFGSFGPRWLVQRKVASNVLYVFTNARRNPLEEMVQEEVGRLCSLFSECQGRPIDPHDGVFTSVGSVLYQLCYGRNEDIRMDKNFSQFIAVSGDFTKFTGAGNPVDVMPWLRFVMPGSLRRFMAVVNKMSDLIEGKLKEQAETFSVDHQRHLTDGLIQAAMEIEANPQHGVTGDNIRHMMADINTAGFETVSSTVMWGILLLTNNPEVQGKVSAEIEEVIGSRAPRLEDKGNLPYVMATVHEIMRFSNIVPLAIPHAAVRDTEFRGYRIKKGTVILPNMYSLSHDREIWGDPENFRPERYLDHQGQLDKSKTDLFTPFSMGRRKCLGEALAKMEVFLFLASIFQRCEFSLPEGVSELCTEGSFSLAIKPEPFKVVVKIRA